MIDKHSPPPSTTPLFLFQARSTMDNKNKMREDQKNDYILQLQNTNKDQEEHYYKKVPTIFNVSKPVNVIDWPCKGVGWEGEGGGPQLGDLWVT